MMSYNRDDILYPVQTAFIMINCESNHELDVVEQLGYIKEVSKVVRTNGMYNIVITVESPTEDKLKELIQYIRKIQHIRSTTTLIKSRV